MAKQLQLQIDRASFTKLDNDEWGVRVEGTGADTLAGTDLVVTLRSGATRDVTLGALVQKWNGGTKATYLTAGKKDDRPQIKPRGKVVLGIADLQKLVTEHKVVVAGVTIVFDGEGAA